MPAYNAATTIAAAVTSVLRQTVKDFELIVVDDGSSDDTFERLSPLQADARLTVIQQPNRGPAAARNAGIDASGAPIVSVIDSDDLWLPTYLEVMGTALARDPAAGFAYTDAWIFDETHHLVARRTAMSGQRPPNPPPSDSRAFLLELLDRNFVYTSASVPRKVLSDVGFYDERFRYGEDFELWLRIIESERHAVRVSGDLAIHRIRSSSLTSDVRSFYEGICDVYATIADEHALDPVARAVVLKRLAVWRREVVRLDERSRSARLIAAARLVRDAILSHRRWLKHPPHAVAETLDRCGITGEETRMPFIDPSSAP